MGLEKVIAGIAVACIAAEGAGAALTNDTYLLRPPGAKSEADFMSRCIKCGKCIEACPYQAIISGDMLSGAAVSTPCIDPENRACMLCEDFPCVAACPTGALRDIEKRSDVDMGYAKLNENSCIAFQGYRCEVCYRVCPLIDEAITIEYESLENDSIHTKFIPKVNKEKCTGCGLCVQRCVVREPRLAIKIVSKAEQEKKGRKN